MPELPDLTVVAEAFHAALAGRRIRSASAPGPLAVRGTPSELQALVGQRIEAIRRRGKFLMIDLDRDAVVVNPMLTGRFQLAAPGAKPRPGRPSSSGSDRAMRLRPMPPPGPRAQTWRPADADGVEVRYRDPTQMGKVYLQPAGVDRPIAGLGGTSQAPTRTTRR